MSLIVTLAILFVVEIVVVGAIFGLLYNKKMPGKPFDKNAELVEIYRKRLNDYETKMEANLVDLHNIGDKLGELMEPIKDTAFRHRKKEAQLIDKRIQFIQSEISAIVNKEYGDDYWDNLCIRLSELLPSPVINMGNNPGDEINNEETVAEGNYNEEPGNEESGADPAEDVEADTEFAIDQMEALANAQLAANADDEIPILSHKIRIDKNSPTIAYITLTPLQNEIKRLKRIVGRHFGMLSDMKQAIIENKNDMEHFTKLPKALKELQIVHVQLTRSVKALKDENARLTKILTTNNSIAGDSADLMDDSKRKALAALKKNQAPQRPSRRRSAKG